MLVVVLAVSAYLVDTRIAQRLRKSGISVGGDPKSYWPLMMARWGYWRATSIEMHHVDMELSDAAQLPLLKNLEDFNVACSNFGDEHVRYLAEYLACVVFGCAAQKYR